MNEIEVILMRCALSASPSVRTALTTELQNLEIVVDGQVMAFLMGALGHAESFGVPWSETTAGKYGKIVESLEPINDPSAPSWAISQLRMKHRDEKFASVLLEAMTILKSPENGSAPPFNKALLFLTSNLPAQALGSPEEEDVDLKAQYLERKIRGVSGLVSGINVVDVLSDGQNPGEFWMTCGYTGTGKSFHLINVAYSRRLLGLNGIYFSTEMGKRQLERRFTVRHSRHDKFGLVTGLSDKKIKRADLSEDLEELWLDRVIPDWKELDAGKLEILPVGAGVKLSEIFSAVERIHKNEWPVHYVMLDYLSQMRPSDRISDGRFQQTALIIECKAFALHFDNRKGLPVWTAAQTNPSSMAQAHKDGFYGIRAVAETSEAERSSDLLMYLLRRESDKSKAEVASGVLKYRDGSSDLRFSFAEDFDTAFLGDKTMLESADDDWSLTV